MNKETETKKVTKPKGKYFHEVGRRKSSVARVIMTPFSKTKNEFVVNGKDILDYFKTDSLRHTANEAILKLKPKQKFSISAKVNGGGISSQAQAVRHGVSRILVKFEEFEKDEEARKKLKKAGLLKRDPRSKERRKFGLKKARKRAQWSKR